MPHVADFVTIALLVALEGLLSADNAMVLAVLVLGLPTSQQQKALRYGIVGAFAFRIAATLLAVYLISLGWVKLLGAIYLLYLVYRHFAGAENAEARRTPRKARAWLGLTAFFTMVTASSFVAPVAAKAVNERSVAITVEAMATDVFARMLMLIAVLQASPTDIPNAFPVRLAKGPMRS